MRELLREYRRILITGANAFNERTDGVGEGLPEGVVGRNEREVCLAGDTGDSG